MNKLILRLTTVLPVMNCRVMRSQREPQAGISM